MLDVIVGIFGHTIMTKQIKYPKIIKSCPICVSKFETYEGSPLEKIFCSKLCAGKSRIVPNKIEKQNERRRQQYANLSKDEKEKRNKVSKIYSSEHRQELNEYAKEFRKNNPEIYRAYQKKAREKLKTNNPEHLMWMEIKKRAKKKNIPFNLDVEDILIPKLCPILGIELKQGVGCVQDSSPSMDRIIPEKGYVKGNCFVISSKANRLKQEHTLETLEIIIKYIKERLVE
jgi:hypothetical protein